MRLLFLSTAFPLPANNGYKLRNWAFLKALAAEGHAVALVAFSDPHEGEDADGEVARVCSDVEAIPFTPSSLSASTDYWGRFRSLLSREPYGVRRFRSGAMRERIARHLGAGRVDGIVCDIFAVPNIPSTTVPIILNNHNVEHLILRRYLKHERHPLKWSYAWLEALKLRRLERDVCRGAALGMACSEPDRQVLQSLAPTLRTVVLPNVVDADAYSPAGGGDPLTVVFQGGMDWYPNRDAVTYFVSHIFPGLQRLVPGVRFVVAGRNPSPELLRRFAGTAGVGFTGTLPDIRGEIAKAAVCVVPLRIGSGTRLKIIEAAAMEKAIVSTPLGAEGLEFVDGEEILIADGHVAFMQAVADLLGDDARRRAMGAAARRRVEAQYDGRALQRAVRAALETLRASDASSTATQEV
jgi:polysaccharide biosynthesis protein PslH